MRKEQKMSPGELFLIQIWMDEQRELVEKAISLYAESFKKYEAKLKERMGKEMAERDKQCADILAELERTK